MRPVAAIEDPAVAKRLLEHLGLPTQLPFDLWLRLSALSGHSSLQKGVDFQHQGRLDLSLSDIVTKDPAEKTGRREHVRCPCCGRLARCSEGTPLPALFRCDHSFDSLIQSFPGGGKAGAGHGFAWTPGELTQEQLMALERVVSDVSNRLKKEIGGDLPPTESREAALRGEVAKLKKTITKQKKLIRLAEEQLRLNAAALRELQHRQGGPK